MVTSGISINSILFDTDSYKVSMWKQYPENTEIVFSYISARKGSVPAVVIEGANRYVRNVLSQRVTREQVLLAEKFWTAHGEPFNTDGWMYIVEKLGGVLPLKLRAVPEGTAVPIGNVVATLENTDPNVPWLTTWMETSLLRAIWYPSSVATTSFYIKRMILEYLEKSGDVSGVDFKLHDFGARGSHSNESASVGGCAHLSVFKGTDTSVGIVSAFLDYDADLFTTGFSIPAAEHSTITSWGRENELDAYVNQVKQFGKPGAIFAVVSDSYNIFDACVMWASNPLRKLVQDSGATLVVRPDSGDPVDVLTSCISILAEGYGFTLNEKGYKVLNTVRFIWGDGINEKSIRRMYTILVDKLGWSADNFAFGMGGALLGKPQRDDLGWAMKASAIRVNGRWHAFCKDPVTDPDKKSFKGRVTLYRLADGRWYTGAEDWVEDALDTVYDSGVSTLIQFEQVRKNVERSLTEKF